MGKNHRNKNNKSGSNKHQQQPINASTHAADSDPTKQQQKQHLHQAPTKRHTLTLQKRNELSTLVKSLLEIGFKQSSNSKEEWDQYVEIQSLLHRVQILEAPLRRTTSNPNTEARMANIDNFYRWVTENHLRYDGLRIAQFPGYELGLEATRDIAKDEVLFSIPRKLILSEENLDLEASPVQFGSMSNLILSYVLMLEALKPNSFWKPYIDLLPEKYNTVLYFNTKEMEMLRGSNALTAALRQCKAIARQYAFLYNSTVQAPNADKFNPMGQTFKDQFSYELYRWAVSTVMTRENLIPRSRPLTNGGGRPETSQDTENIAALIPFWDMANHRDGHVTSYFNIGTQEMESTAQCSFKAGEQIFIHYGKRSNADCMIHNGYNFPPDRYPPLDEVRKNVSLVFTNHHFSQGPIRPNVPNLIEIGGIQIKEKPDPLPTDIAKLLDESKDGVIYFSLGTNIQGSHLTKEKIKIIFNVISKLPYKVLWKWGEQDRPGESSNIIYKEWLPQDDILAHPKIKLFITHGGMGSVVEAQYHGVPMVGIPLFGDQPSNMANVVRSGYGLSVDYLTLSEESLNTAVQEVLNNPKYTKTVRDFSRLYRDRPMTPRQTVVYWTEYVLRHNGAKHMQSPAVHMNRWQLMSLDVISFLLAFVGGVVFVFVQICKLLCCRGRKGDKVKVSKANQKNKKNE